MKNYIELAITEFMADNDLKDGEEFEIKEQGDFKFHFLLGKLEMKRLY